MTENTKNNYNIRMATVWDAKIITDLWEKEIKEAKFPFMIVDEKEKERFFISIIKKIKDKNFCILVAESKNKIVAFVMGNLKIHEYGNSNIAGCCENIYIKSEHRSKGLFKELLDLLILWGKAANMKQMEFLTNVDEKLIKVYKKLGYKPCQIVWIKEV